MCEEQRIRAIREAERRSHETMYVSQELYAEGSWLQKPVQTVLELIPLFRSHRNLRILDLGCGVGRNCLPFAEAYRDTNCKIECVDILGLAIEKLLANAVRYGVAEQICGIVRPIEDYPIAADRYDLILAVSALEHVDSRATFCSKLRQIRCGVRSGGVVCLILNSGVTERDADTGEQLPPQFEVNLPETELLACLDQTFAGWEVLRRTVRLQRYMIPRDGRASELHTSVVTFVAKACACSEDDPCVDNN